MSFKFKHFVLILPIALIICSWGFYAHKTISRTAVFTLPKELIGFYKNHINFITEHSVDPDKRRYIDSLEGHKHYFDADRYGISPFDSVPKKWNDAVAKYSLDTLNAFGVVPWQIEKTYNKLVNAFKYKDEKAILKYSSDLGHYIADAHVPLHTTENYNGQLTNQMGIHAFWESRLPELFAKDYDFFVGKAYYINSANEEAWKILKETYHLVDSTLRLEKELNSTFSSDKKYTFSERNNKVIKEYSVEYSSQYHDMLNKMVERQMRKSILAIGCFWYSAWIDAGQPDLTLKNKLTEAENFILDREEKLYQEGKVIGRPDF